MNGLDTHYIVKTNRQQRHRERTRRATVSQPEQASLQAQPRYSNRREEEEASARVSGHEESRCDSQPLFPIIFPCRVVQDFPLCDWVGRVLH